MNDPHPRYVVREISGYSSSHGSGPAHTSVWVADSWDCCREVATFYTKDRKFGCPPYAPRRAAAESRCAELNAEHDAWLAAG